MIPRELIGIAPVPGGGELRCFRHDGDYYIYSGNVELMSTRVYGAEEALAELAVERRSVSASRRVLVGGLGMGYSLARVLALVGPEARVDVAELVPEVVTWNRELFGACAGHPLRDERAHLVVADVGAVLAGARDVYDVVLLDVDNGPEALSRPDNRGLYSQRGLARARDALRRGGVLAIWSSGENLRFERRLQRSGFEVSRWNVRARRDKGPRRVIWVATRP